MNYLAKTGLNLVEILSFSDKKYSQFKEKIASRATVTLLSSVFDKTREWIIRNKSGSNVIRYLLHGLNNKIIKQQYDNEENYKMKGLYLDNKAIPFDEMPFNSGLCNHNPSKYDLLDCIDASGREHELLAHRIGDNSDIYGTLYTKDEELSEFQNIDVLVERFNGSLYKKHQNRRIERLGKNLYIKGYENDVKRIIEFLISLSVNGVEDYKASVEDWLMDNPLALDCEEKKGILERMFEQTKVAMIYGAAGTGKSTLIKHIAQFWEDSSKVFISNTHPAVENLRRRVKDNTAEYMTIKSFIYSYPSFKKIDILFVDECSMVSNRDMLEIINKGNFELLVLVGDIYQIEAIQFGNWFNLARYFVPLNSQHELNKPYRTDDKYLLELWNRVRNYQDDITEWLSYCGYTSDFEESVFEPESEDEIVLCLNYDGLYGINNMNRFFQNTNANKAVSLGVWLYKVNDPVLFTDSTRFGSVLYNNLKGKIVDIEEEEEKIFFSIEIDKTLNGIQAAGTGLELMSDGELQSGITAN